MEIKNKLFNMLWRSRHWSTKLIWTLGLLLVLTCTVLVLLFPPGITGKGYTFVYGQTIKQGILNASYGIDVPTNISCNKTDDCPWFDGERFCRTETGFCQRPSVRVEPDLGSFSFRIYDSSGSSLIGREIAVKGDLKEGEWARLALEKDMIKQKGGLFLWNEQRRILGAFWLPGFVVWLNEETYNGCSDPGDCGWGLLFLIPLWVLYSIGGFVFPRDKFWVRLLSGFCFAFVLFSILLIISYVIGDLAATMEKASQVGGLSGLLHAVLYLILYVIFMVYGVLFLSFPLILIFSGVCMFAYSSYSKLKKKSGDG